MIFETRTLEAGEGIPVDDIIEASNHFRCVDYVLDVATEPLSEEMIKRLHFLLKQGTKIPIWIGLPSGRIKKTEYGGRTGNMSSERRSAGEGKAS